MKITTLLVFLVLWVLSFSTFAVRHVGSGGGEAELTLLQMNSLAPVWALACQQNPKVCWSAGAIPAEIHVILPSLKLSFSEEKKSYQNAVLTLKNSDLYEADQQTPLADLRLVEIYLRSLFAGFNHDLPQDLRLGFLPLGRKTPEAKLFFLKGTTSDVLVSPFINQSLHEMFKAKTRCARYQYAANTSDGFIVQCLQDARTYQVFLLNSESGLQFNVLYEGNDKD